MQIAVKEKTNPNRYSHCHDKETPLKLLRLYPQRGEQGGEMELSLRNK